MKDPERTEAAKEPAFIETLNKLRRDKLSSMPKPDESAYGSRWRGLEDSLFRPPSQKPRAFDLKKTIMAAEKAVVLDNSNRERRRDEDASGLGGRGGAESLKRLRSSGSGVGSAVGWPANLKKQKRVHSLPMDWSPKKSATFKSSSPFDCFMASFNLAPELNHQAMRSFTNGNRRSRDANQMYLQSLYSWKFPLLSLQGKNHLGGPNAKAKPAIGNGADWDALVSHRLRVFREAARDLVYALYAGMCATFYVLPPPGSPDAFVCVFRAKGIEKKRRVSAVVTSARQGMVALMREDFGLDPAEEEGARAEEEEAEAGDHGGLAGSLAGGGGGQVLTFWGREQVHGLFDFLISTCGSVYHKGRDTPILLAPVPFEGASLKRYRGTYRKHALRQNELEKVETFCLSFQDEEDHMVIPPWVLDRLCATFRKTQGTFTMTTETAPNLMVGLAPPPPSGGRRGGNSRSIHAKMGHEEEELDEDEAVAGDSQICGSGYWDTEELEKWESPSAAFSKVACEKGVFYLTQ